MNFKLIKKAIADSALGEDCLGNRLYLDVNSEMVNWLVEEVALWRAARQDEFYMYGMHKAAKRCVELANDCAAGHEAVAAITREFKL